MDLQLTMTAMTQQKSRSYNQHQLKAVCDKLCDNIDDLLQMLGVEDLKHNGKMLVGKCPIHDGDNITAFNIYPDGEHYRGNWKCRTHNCEEVFKSSIIGFVRGVLSNKQHGWIKNGDQTVSFQDTIQFIEGFLNHDIKDIKVSRSEVEKAKFTSIISNITNKPEKIFSGLRRNVVRQTLTIPSTYFVNRGFSPEILDRYDVGLCSTAGKEMHNRAVAPIYDNDYKHLVGCTGRSVFDKCENCSYYHDPNNNCPSEHDRWKYPKWKHNHQFKSQNHLYNFWFAKTHILESTQVILVESPGNVWRLEEAGIHNSVAMFGSSLSDRQKIILDGSGAMHIVILTDNDEAGNKAAQVITDKCKNTYRINKIAIEKADVAEMSVEEIKQVIKPQLERIS